MNSYREFLRGILSPLRLPVPPPRHNLKFLSYFIKFRKSKIPAGLSRGKISDIYRAIKNEDRTTDSGISVSPSKAITRRDWNKREDCLKEKGTFLVKKISGSHSNVAGLPISEVADTFNIYHGARVLQH